MGPQTGERECTGRGRWAAPDHVRPDTAPAEVRSVAKYERWLEPQGLTLLEGWARDGLSEEQIAKNCGVSISTLREWKKRFPALTEALKKSKELVDYQVENALLKRALGYEYTEVMVAESDEGTRRRETVKQVPPSVTAQIYWLKNHRSDKWRDKPREDRADGTGESGVVVLAPVEECEEE